ncbi:ENTH domain-containing protein [Yarrowia sp. C11]|nr:ENTH domain-containing protein [Yarrowia sp. E02]KAG5369554.1 ENTH domain-containing protein [Yarrowia sp. C11]
MDQIRDQLANVSLYDVKAYVRKAQNAVMNFTPIEAKVREATNNEPWGASSTAMQEIADATHNYNEFHDIMSMIYRRFTDKTSEEWRQIYKALQLLDFLIKHGSERVIDYARSHVGVIQMLKNFHFIDANGKDQGINVRNRAKELNELLKDVARIRAERKKARTQKSKTKGFGGTGNKYGGFGNDAASSIQLGGSAGGSRAGRYSTSGSSGYGGYGGGRVFGDGGGFDGSEYDGPGYGNSAEASGSGEFNDNDSFEEYDAGGAAEYESAPPPVPSKAAKTDDPFGFDAAPAASAAPASSAAADDDDEFDDFQSATPASTAATSAAPAPAAPKPGLTNLDDLFKNIPTNTGASNGSGSLMGGSFTAASPSVSSGGPNYAAFSSFQSSSGGMSSSTPALGGSGLGGASTPASASSSGLAAKPAAAKSSGGADAFSNLWSTASSGVAKGKKNEPTTSLSSMAKKSNEEALWGAPASSSSSTPAPASKPAETGNLLDL